MGLFGRQEPEVCWVRSSTNDPCGRPATVKIQGVPFCERCAREYEGYAAIGMLTDSAHEGDPGRRRDASLAESLKRLRGEDTSRVMVRGEPRRGQKA